MYNLKHLKRILFGILMSVVNIKFTNIKHCENS